MTVDGDLQAGDVIEVVSSAPRIDRDSLAAADSTGPGDPIYTSVPTDLPEIVGATARRVTAGAVTPYDTALSLQAFFQNEFAYSLEIRPGHGNSAIESFLEQRIGYCEQFAGTYAAMMRSLGIPSRVAVGFTSGIAQGEGEFSVLGRNAHAWPEVWFDGIGWVAFEPTPGRGAPNAENYTGLAPRQDTSATTTDGLAPTTTVPPAVDGDDPGLEIPDFSDVPPADVNPSGDSGSGASSAGGGAPWGWLTVIALLAGAVATPRLVRVARGRRRARSLELQVASAWQRATRAVQAAGVPISDSDTPLEVAARTARHFPLVTRPMSSLADVVTQATYGVGGTSGYDAPGTYGASTISDCRNWAKQIDRTATESLDWRIRLRRYFTSFG